jgi:uncharacterized protein YhdP
VRTTGELFESEGFMTRIFFLKIITAILFTAVLFSATVSVLLPRVLNLDNYKTHILNLLETSLKRPVSFDTAAISWQIPPAVVVKGVTIKENAGDTKLLTVDRLTFRLALLPLLRKEVHIQGVVLERPELVLDRKQDGTFSLNDLFTDTPSTREVQVNSIRIVDGRLRFTDHLRENGVLTTTVEQLNAQINGLKRGRSSQFKLSAVVHDQGRREELSISGEAVIPRQGEAFRTIKLDAAVAVKNLDLARYWPYYGRFLPFENIHGQLDGEAKIQGKWSDFTSEGHFRLKKLQLEYPQIFHSKITPEEIKLDYNVTLDPQKLLVTSLDLKVDRLQLKGSGALSALHGKDPHLKVKLSSSPLAITELKRYIPYGIIPKGTTDFIEQYIIGGVLRIEEGILDGKISQILTMGTGTNYNALSVRASIDNGLLRFGPQVPVVSNIKTDLEFRGKDFSLRNTSGFFGSSPFTLEGTIAGYPLDTPASYPFSMRMTPAQSEIDWLLRQNGGLKLTGASTLILSGSGMASDYRLSGSWDLSGAAYQCSSFITKPAGMVNRISFGAVLDATEARISELHYELPSLNVTANATYRYNDKVPLSCAVTTNQFNVGKLLPVVHGLDSYHPFGMAKTAFTASGNPSAPDTFSWKGAVTFAGFAFRPSEQIAPLSDINGSITFSGSGLETKQLTGKIGKSDITVSGSVMNLTAPITALHFSSPLLHLNDLGFTSAGQDLAVKNVSSKVSMDGNNLNIESLVGQLNQTAIALHSDLFDVKNPHISLRVHFPYFSAEDLLPLRDLRREGRDEAKTGIKSLNARVTIDAGTVGKMPFRKLDTQLSITNDHVNIKKTSLDAFGGKVSGSGSVDLSPKDGPLYISHYRLDNVEVTQLLAAMGKERVISGQLTSEGELTAKGNSVAELEKSLRGSNNFQMEKGLIYKSNVLLKVFSIFNVTRILKFRLPRIAQEGTMYDSIQGNFTIRDGSAETTDLTLQSPSVTVKAVGKTDFVKKELDMVLAAQPLQTVSYVVSHIPVFGWLLTGGNESFLVSFFDVKGRWDDPAVSTRPVENLSIGVYNVFKRTFMLPETLFTDTNKVLFD